jgi:Protein of unknown function (DUF1579)
MRVLVLASFLLAAGAAYGQTPAATQSSKPEDAPAKANAPAAGGQQPGSTVSDPHKENLLNEIAKTATPDAHHKGLEPLIGKWNTSAKMWLGGPKPETASGHALVESILGGRFVEEHYDTVIWGKPFAAQGQLGYDERAQQYTIGWIDSWGSWITVAQGQGDVTGHVLTLTSKDYDNPAGKTRPVKFIISIDSHDHHTRKVFEKVEGKETLTMEIEYRRTK